MGPLVILEKIKQDVRGMHHWRFSRGSYPFGRHSTVMQIQE